jgi:uncharacterized protein YlaN (UPF0358 family)
MSKNGQNLSKCSQKVEEVISILEELLSRTQCKFVKEVLPGQIGMLKNIVYAEGKLKEMVDREEGGDKNGKEEGNHRNTATTKRR